MRIPVAVRFDALYSIIVVNLLLWVMITIETLFIYDKPGRYRLRHGMEYEISTSSWVNQPSGPDPSGS